jgi:hypothetical protein
MFDEFEPVPSLNCPRCDATIDGWQGKDGPCCLVRWRQGHAQPEVLPDEADWVDATAARLWRLPRSFGLYTTCESCGLWVDATGYCQDDIWSYTVLGLTVVARAEPAFSDEPGRRRCGRCNNVWVADPVSDVGPCPACGVATRLVP